MRFYFRPSHHLTAYALIDTRSPHLSSAILFSPLYSSLLFSLWSSINQKYTRNTHTFARIHRNAQGYTGIHRNIQERTENTQEYTGLHRITQEYTQIYKNIHRITQEYTGKRRNIQKFMAIYRHNTRAHINTHKSTGIHPGAFFVFQFVRVVYLWSTNLKAYTETRGVHTLHTEAHAPTREGSSSETHPMCIEDE